MHLHASEPYEQAQVQLKFHWCIALRVLLRMAALTNNEPYADSGMDPVIFMALVGGCFLLLGALFTVQSVLEITTWTPAKGTVIEIVRQQHIQHPSTYAPKVRFKTKDGKEETFVSRSSSNPPGFQTGQDVSVLYDPNNPESALLG
jgi:hypothetical protein